MLSLSLARKSFQTWRSASSRDFFFFFWKCYTSRFAWLFTYTRFASGNADQKNVEFRGGWHHEVLYTSGVATFCQIREFNSYYQDRSSFYYYYYYFFFTETAFNKFEGQKCKTNLRGKYPDPYINWPAKKKQHAQQFLSIMNVARARSLGSSAAAQRNKFN